MRVHELIEELERMDPKAEVRIAHQPGWPFEYGIGGVIQAGGGVTPMPDEDDYEDEDEYIEALEEWEEQDQLRDPVVYVAEKNQLGYLPAAAARQLGW